MVKNIYLLGFMGSGKSTVGPLLARKMERSFYDLDVLIEKEKNMRVSEIFESKGESFFRVLESRVWLRVKIYLSVLWLSEVVLLSVSQTAITFQNKESPCG